ncbi:MAG: hypothetical protein D6816_19710, partial [Bacteroidetes bacterium]
MELAGFRLSTADRLRVLRLLATVGKHQLKEPQKLKNLLCPALARSQAEQERFYELFDQWWE